MTVGAAHVDHPADNMPTPAMPDQSPTQVTHLLGELEQGDRSAAQRLFPLVYSELRALAGSFFAQQLPGHTLQPTALVHDAYLKMVGSLDSKDATPAYRNRGHFFAIAAKAMRQILTDHARRRMAAKRGGVEATRIDLDEDIASERERSVDLLELDEAMSRLAQLDARKAQVVELRFFGGLTNEEVADVLDVSRATVADDWTVARAWLRAEMTR